MQEDDPQSESLRRNLLTAANMVTPQSLAIAKIVQEVAVSLGASPAQVAIAWLLSRAAVTAPIIGARTLNQFEDNVSALDCSLDTAHRERLEAASAIDLGFPHDFLASSVALNSLFAGVSVRSRP
jgi:aryl-alcohol dehydrogenase-like predicted oxidoreductase